MIAEARQYLADGNVTKEQEKRQEQDKEQNKRKIKQ